MITILLWIPPPQSKPIFIKLCIYIMTTEPISMAYFINLSHQSVCAYVYAPTVTRQRLCKNITVEMNTHSTIEELLDASFPMRSVSCQRKVCD
jgi:hypothetical protein